MKIRHGARAWVGAVVAGASTLLLIAPQAHAITIDTTARTVSAAKISMGWTTTNTPDEVDSLQWTDSSATQTPNLVSNGGGPAGCDAVVGPTEFWGQSLGSTGLDPILVLQGNTGTWTSPRSDQVQIASSFPTDCSSYTASVPVTTTYGYFDDATYQNEVRIARTYGFDLAAPPFTGSDGFRAYVPRLPLAGYPTVVYPTTGSNLGTIDAHGCSSPCFPSDYDQSAGWFAMESSAGTGMIMVRDPSDSFAAKLEVDNDDNSASDLSGFDVLNPGGGSTSGFLGAVTEVEYLCFFDPTTWPASAQSSLTLPAGCGAGPVPANTAAPSVPAAQTQGTATSADPGAWSSSPVAYSYQWVRCDADGTSNCGDIGSATSRSYTPVLADVGKTLKVRVVASNGFGDSSSVTSAASDPVQPAVLPTATTGGTTHVARDGATLLGVVDPNGVDTSYWFEYGTTTAYGSSTPAADAGSDNSFAAAADVVDLAPHTTYHYRLVAQNSNGIGDGADRTFTTLGPPLVSTGAATNVTGTSATLSGSVNPQSSDTQYHFDYGTTTAYGASAPAPDADLGAADLQDHPVSLDLPAGTLASGTTYHFRLVATNADGTTDGADRTLTTLAAPPAVDSEGATVRPTTVVLSSVLEMHNLSGSYHFEWGPATPNTCDVFTQAAGNCPPPSYAPSYTNHTAETAVGPREGSNVVEVAQVTSPMRGEVVSYRVVVKSTAGTTTGPDEFVAVDGTPPAATSGAATDKGGGTLALGAQITPNGYDVGYHFHVSLAGGCTSGTQAVDTPEQTLAGGYSPVAVAGTITVPPGTSITWEPVVDWTSSDGTASSAQGTAVTSRASGSTSAGDVVDVTGLQPTSAGVGIFVAATSPLAQGTPGWTTSSTGWYGTSTTYHPPLLVRSAYGTGTAYDTGTDGLTWTADGSVPTCAFVGTRSLTGLSPATTYHVRAESGYEESGSQLNPYCGFDNSCNTMFFEGLGATAGVAFTTPAGTTSSTTVYVPTSGTLSGTVSCSTSLACSGSLSYTTQLAGAAAKGRAAVAKAIVLGSTRFRLPAGSKRRINVRLNGAGRRLVRKRGLRTVVEVLTIRAGGGRAVTTRRVVHLTPAGRRGSGAGHRPRHGARG